MLMIIANSIFMFWILGFKLWETTWRACLMIAIHDGILTTCDGIPTMQDGIPTMYDGILTRWYTDNV